jgi:hypothetical protein
MIKNKLFMEFKHAIQERHAGFSIEKSKIHGVGVISKRVYEPGDLIGIALYWSRKSYPLTTTFGANINHSYSPNAETRNEGEYYKTYAIKRIDVGDEIVVDYTINKDLEQPEDGWK